MDPSANIYKRTSAKWSLFKNTDLKTGFDNNTNAAALSSKVVISKSSVNNNASSDIVPFTFWMTDEFEYSINADWKQTIDLASAFAGLNKVTSYVGSANIGNAGISTRQTYTGSGFIAITVRGRLFHPRMVRSDLVTGFGSKDIYSQVNYLNKLVIPGGTTQFSDLISRSNGSDKTKLESAQSVFSKDGSVFNVNSYIFRNPPIFNLKIGNMFNNDAMVCKNLRVKFSKEFCNPIEDGLSERQPVYADVDLDFGSLYAVSSPNTESGNIDSFMFFVGDAFNSISSNSIFGTDEDIAATQRLAELELGPSQKPEPPKVDIPKLEPPKSDNTITPRQNQSSSTTPRTFNQIVGIP